MHTLKKRGKLILVFLVVCFSSFLILTNSAFAYSWNGWTLDYDYSYPDDTVTDSNSAADTTYDLYNGTVGAMAEGDLLTPTDDPDLGPSDYTAYADVTIRGDLTIDAAEWIYFNFHHEAFLDIFNNGGQVEPVANAAAVSFFDGFGGVFIESAVFSVSDPSENMEQTSHFVTVADNASDYYESSETINDNTSDSYSFDEWFAVYLNPGVYGLYLTSSVSVIGSPGTYAIADSMNTSGFTFQDFAPDIAYTILSDPPQQAPVPEPATILLLGVGIAGLAGASRRKLKK